MELSHRAGYLPDSVPQPTYQARLWLCVTGTAIGNISKGSPTRFRLLQEAGTLPVKALDANVAYCSLGKEPQDNGKEPFSLLFPRSKYISCNKQLFVVHTCLNCCNQNLVLIIEHMATYTMIQHAKA